MASLIFVFMSTVFWSKVFLTPSQSIWVGVHVTTLSVYCWWTSIQSKATRLKSETLRLECIFFMYIFYVWLPRSKMSIHVINYKQLLHCCFSAYKESSVNYILSQDILTHQNWLKCQRPEEIIAKKVSSIKEKKIKNVRSLLISVSQETSRA